MTGLIALAAAGGSTGSGKPADFCKTVMIEALGETVYAEPHR
jgi:hypothetical protein